MNQIDLSDLYDPETDAHQQFDVEDLEMVSQQVQPMLLQLQAMQIQPPNGQVVPATNVYQTPVRTRVLQCPNAPLRSKPKAQKKLQF